MLGKKKIANPDAYFMDETKVQWGSLPWATTVGWYYGGCCIPTSLTCIFPLIRNATIVNMFISSGCGDEVIHLQTEEMIPDQGSCKVNKVMGRLAASFGHIHSSLLP